METLNLIDPDEALPEVEKMLYDLAWKCTNAYAVPFDESRSEAYYAFMKACRTFDPQRGSKFSSWCYFLTWTHLKTYITKRTLDPLSFGEIDEELVGAAPAERSESLEVVEDLSTDAREIISLLVETPGELLGSCPMSAKQLLVRVKAYLVSKGRNKSEVDKAHKEIKIRLQAAWGHA